MKHEKKSKLKRNTLVFEIVSVTILGLYALSLLGCLTVTVFNSLKSIINFTLDPLGFPSKLRFDNFPNAMEQLKVTIQTATSTRDVKFLELFINSLLYVAGCSLVGVFAHFTCAYVTAKYPSPLTKLIHTLVVVEIVFPNLGGMVSSMILLRATGIYNNMLMYWLYCAGFTGSHFLIFYATCKGLDNAYLDAARLDGAGFYHILFRIAIPMTKNVITGILLLKIIGLWNDWHTPMMYLPSTPTISYALYRFQFNTVNSVSQVPARMAGSVLVMIPTLLLFIVFKNKFIGNITFGGLKG